RPTAAITSSSTAPSWRGSRTAGARPWETPPTNGCGAKPERKAESAAPRPRRKTPLSTLRTFLISQHLEQRSALVGGRGRAGRRGKLDDLVQLLPGRAGPARRERVHLRGGQQPFGQQHAEQDQVGGLGVEHLRVERVRAHLLDAPQRLGIDLA